MLEDYADVFNSSGEISIVYRNSQLNALIYSDQNFARLGSTGLYEPVLSAGIKIFGYYVPRMDIDNISVSKKHAQPLYDALEDLKAKLDAFMLAKTNLEARETIDPEGVIEQSLLNILCEKYKDLVNSACSLGDKFSQLYHQDVFEDYVPKDGQRYAIGKMRLTVLDKLNEFAKLEANNRMIYYQDKPYNSTVIASNCVRVLNAFNKVKSIALWEGDDAELSAEEASIVKLFGAMLNYDTLYQQAVGQYNIALQNITLANYYNYISGSYDRSEFETKELIYFEKLDEYFSTDATNMINYIINLCDKIKTFKS